MDAKPKKQFPGSGKFDSVNSTYKHQIYLTNGKKLSGYSKALLYPEMQDKIVLLERMILRLFNSGYFDPLRTYKIEYYKKEFMKPDELIFTLYPTEISYADNPDFISDKRLNAFFKKFYDSIEAQKIVTKDITHNAIYKKVDDILTLDYKRFKTERELLDFIGKKLIEGLEHGSVMNFFFKYKERYLTI